MTTRIAGTLALSCVLVACAASPRAATPACERHLVVHVLDVKSAVGQIPVALWSSKETFLRRGDWFAASSSPALAPETVVDLGNIPCGRYAISVFHDRTNAGALRRGLFGVPLDPWAFSAAPTLFGPPAFDRASFVVDEGDEPLVVEVRLVGGTAVPSAESTP